MARETPSRAAQAAIPFRRIVARAPDAGAAERALAEAMEAGAAGAEQREEAVGRVTLVLYAAAEAAGAVARAARSVLGADAVEAPAEVETRDWSEAWKEGLAPVEVSPRLRIRPSFESRPGRAGQRDLVIDPGQAFGTGGHESTRLALDWLDVRRADLAGGSAVLDVGTGTGVLALAALALGAPGAVGCDLDPLAAPAARAHARLNGLEERALFFTGGLDALVPGRRWPAVVANLLRRESEPILAALASRVEVGGWLVVSGLLEEEVAAFADRAAGEGLALEGTRRRSDASGGVWAALLMRRRPAGS